MGPLIDSINFLRGISWLFLSLKKSNNFMKVAASVNIKKELLRHIVSLTHGLYFVRNGQL